MKKLFSMVCATAMMVTILPTAMSVKAVEATATVEISNVAELSDAIKNQADNQVWKIASGNYVLTQTDLDKYASIKPGTSGQGNWYFPIHKSITMIGEGDVTITSNVERANGVWASQDFISVWADNVTIDNIDFICKKEVNKAIEVMAKNFKLKNSTLLPVEHDGGKVLSGSIYFNTTDSGDALLENVTLSAWISARTVSTGLVTIRNVTQDFSNNEYAGYSDATLGYAWNPNVSGTNVALEGYTIKVDGKSNFTKQILHANFKPGTTIQLTGDITVDEMVNLNKDNVTLDLNGFTITASDTFHSTFDNDAHLLQINANNVCVKNGKLVATAKNKHVVNIFESKNVSLQNITADHTNGFKGAPVVINNSIVSVDGELNLVTGTNSWYGINVDPKGGSASLTFNKGSSVTLSGKTDKLALVVDNKNNLPVTINGTEDAGLLAKENGIYISHKHSYTSKHNVHSHWRECSCGKIIESGSHTFMWVTDKEATDKNDGLKHEECLNCGYETNFQSISKTGETTPIDPGKEEKPEPSKPTIPETGNHSPVGALIGLLLISGSAVTILNSKKIK